MRKQTKSCLVCGTKFTKSPKATVHLYCSTSCKQKGKRLMRWLENQTPKIERAREIKRIYEKICG